MCQIQLEHAYTILNGGGTQLVRRTRGSLLGVCNRKGDVSGDKDQACLPCNLSSLHQMFSCFKNLKITLSARCNACTMNWFLVSSNVWPVYDVIWMGTDSVGRSCL